ncbi:MAG TPA: mercury methylation corrinoid protein HgcA [Clostridia bacterium]|nr:mercury methylation corrinoid protein HgcA [Clostridia bacterium]
MTEDSFKKTDSIPLKVRLKAPESSGSCCCQSDKILMKYSPGASWVTGSLSTAAGPVQKVSVKLQPSDIWGSVRMRFGFDRDNYRIEPGIYCVGEPDSSSPVLVTANYKMTFDSLRMELDGLNAWILVLDTKGINVWCAAGKGTFGTNELIDRISKVKLATIVTHRDIILPQLGASGVSAYTVTRQTGFRVNYGPVRAADLKEYIRNGMKADAGMREVRFNILDRLVLTPNELVSSVKPFLIILGILFLLNMTGIGHFGTVDLYALAGTIFIGTVLTPVLLPFIPGRAFSFKGWLMGMLWSAGVLLMNGFPQAPAFGWLTAAAYMLVLPAVSAYLALNFTGCSTYTSFSGVKREMELSLPPILISAAIGVVLLFTGMLLK